MFLMWRQATLWQLLNISPTKIAKGIGHMAEQNQALRLLTFNVKMLAGIAGKGDKDIARARDIISAITSVQPAYDVVCLQEVFDEDAREVFDNGLKAVFPFRVPRVDAGDMLQQDSGLFFASRYPIKDNGRAWAFEEFEDKAIATADYWADKGIFGARLDLSARVPGLTLGMFQTHLQADYFLGDYEDVRRGQLRQIRRFVRKVLRRVNRPQDTIALLAGDFNVVGEIEAGTALQPAREYLRMLALLGYVSDVFREKHPCEPGYTWDAEQNTLIPAPDGDRQRLDYILAYDTIPPREDGADIRVVACREARVQTFGRSRTQHLSDHFVVEVMVEPGPPPDQLVA